MAPEVLELIDKLYITHKTKKGVQAAFVDRTADSAFGFIGYTAVMNNPNADGPDTRQELIWLGYEVAVDSKWLASFWR